MLAADAVSITFADCFLSVGCPNFLTFTHRHDVLVVASRLINPFRTVPIFVLGPCLHSALARCGRILQDYFPSSRRVNVAGKKWYTKEKKKKRTDKLY